MKLFFDMDMAKIKEDDADLTMYTYYSSYLHNAIKVDALASKLIDYIIGNGFGKELDLDSIHKSISELEVDEIREIIEYLTQTGLFFANSIDYRKHSFSIDMLKSETYFDIERLYVHLTYSCNLECDYCYNREKLNKQKDILKIENWKNVLQTFKSENKPIITITGGEPTLYQGFSDFIKMAHEMGFSLELLTNGTTLNSLSDDIINRINLFIVSLDSLEPEKTHRKNCEKYQVLDNILELKRKNINITVRSVLTKDNKKDVFALREYLEGMEIKHIISYFIPNHPDELELVPSLSNEKCIEGADICNLNKCGACYRILAIDPYGKVFPCQSLMYPDFFLTDINNQEWLEKVRKSEITRYFTYRTVENISDCQHCSVRTVCGGGCKAIAYNLYGDIEHKLDYICDFFKRDSEYRISQITYEEDSTAVSE